MSEAFDFNLYVANIAIGWVVSFLTLFAVHMLLWRGQWRLKPPAPYVVGVLIILAGSAVWAFLQSRTGPVSPWAAVLAVGLIATSGGIILVLYYIHGGVRSLRDMVETKRRARSVLDGVLGGRDAAEDPRRN